MIDRKKKLEEIKRRKLNLQKQLHEQTGEVIPDLNNDPSQISNSNITSTTVSNSQTRRSTKSFFEDSHRKNLIDDINLKKINQKLKESESTDFFLKGIFPETKDEEIQYEEINQNIKIENENKKENIKKNSRRNSKLRQSMDSIKKEEESENKKKKISDEIKNEFIEKNELSFRKFLENQQPILDKYLEINDEYNMGETYYDEEETDVDMSKKNYITQQFTFNSNEDNNEISETKGRIVLSLDWCLKQPDLLLSSFTGSEDTHFQSGLIQLLSITNKKTDYIINYQTELSSAIFHTSNPKLVIGGSATGQVLLWDTKSKPFPIAKTPLNLEALSENRYLRDGKEKDGYDAEKDKKERAKRGVCQKVVSLCCMSRDPNIIYSLTSDGVLSLWSLSNFSKPLLRIELVIKEQNRPEFNQLGVLGVGYNPTMANSILIGSDDYNIYNVSTIDNENNENIINTYSSHGGPVYSVDMHPSSQEGLIDHSDLFLSSSADWTTRLWSTSSTKGPLWVFDQSNDYIYTCKWHPINPSVFVTGDGDGFIDYWDLNREKEYPIFRYDVQAPVNKLSWSYDGKKLAVGDCDGKISIFNCDKDVYTVRNEEFSKFDRVVAGLGERSEGVKDN